MRIISGKFKGRTIKRPASIRPTQDKVRKALFDILGDIQGLSFLELYAGSGAVGLEALSLGASKVVFVEKNRVCIEKIKENIRIIGPLDYQIIKLDVDKALRQIDQNQEKFDIIFLDPPYAPRSRNNIASCSGSREELSQSLAKKTLKTLSHYDIVSHYGLIICQHFKKDNLPGVIDSLNLIKQSKYGDTLLSFYNKGLKHV